MIHPNIGSTTDPARCSGWSTQDPPKGQILITLNDNGDVVKVLMDASTVHGIVNQFIRFAKTHAPLHDENECPVCEQVITKCPPGCDHKGADCTLSCHED